jgi:hypothetical protein
MLIAEELAFITGALLFWKVKIIFEAILKYIQTHAL